MDHDWKIKNSYIDLLHGDCLKRLRRMDDECIDAIITDPPYEISFMGRKWDNSGIAYSVELWEECLRVLKPGGHLAAFSATRTQHRMVCAIEDAGFDIRNQIYWLFGSGFPKNVNISKAIDATIMYGSSGGLALMKANASRPGLGRYRKGTQKNGIVLGATGDRRGPRIIKDTPATKEGKQWQGWGTALKPAHEVICLARKPLAKATVAKNVLKYGTGAINIDACRVGTSGEHQKSPSDVKSKTSSVGGYLNQKQGIPIPKGRWPATVVHDGSKEIVDMFPITTSTKIRETQNKSSTIKNVYGNYKCSRSSTSHDDSGSAARFFYTAKASKHDRLDSSHPTLKPVNLMRWLNKLLTPPNGVILDPFAGTGTTGIAALLEGFDVVLIEKEDEYIKDIVNRFQRYIKKNGRVNLFKTQDHPRWLYEGNYV